MLWGPSAAFREARDNSQTRLDNTHKASPFAAAKKPTSGYLVYRITNPNRFNNHLTPPFTQVLVQSQQPVPGQVYNVLFVVVRNGTAKTFDASSGFAVKLPQASQFFPDSDGEPSNGSRGNNSSSMF